MANPSQPRTNLPQMCKACRKKSSVMTLCNRKYAFTYFTLSGTIIIVWVTPSCCNGRSLTARVGVRKTTRVLRGKRQLVVMFAARMTYDMEKRQRGGLGCFLSLVRISGQSLSMVQNYRYPVVVWINHGWIGVVSHQSALKSSNAASLNCVTGSAANNLLSARTLFIVLSVSPNKYVYCN